MQLQHRRTINNCHSRRCTTIFISQRCTEGPSTTIAVGTKTENSNNTCEGHEVFFHMVAPDSSINTTSLIIQLMYKLN
uniref:Uncharacterized protein n=1 Tax=Tanacetum cinerariifolium TaxID=118510 RepID=A0A6L2NEP7_TANCI|nr:hypothetical protein [Tanacetum cinerariifolium]